MSKSTCAGVLAISAAFYVWAAPAPAGTWVQFTLNGSVAGPAGPINSFTLELYDQAAPVTVANFLHYIADSAYDSTIMHRSVDGFVLQGGGFEPRVELVGDQYQITALDPLAPYCQIINEYSPVRSNIRGTIAMAKVGGNPDSATCQWFINLADNSANLDYQNGGFTVFGQVVGDGMLLVDAAASLPTYNLNPYFDPTGAMGSPFGEVPLFNNGSTFVVVTDAAVVPAPPLSIADLMHLQAHFGQTTAGGRAVGDLDGSTTVGLEDLAALQAALADNPANPAAANVPEPAALGLLATTLLGARRRRSR